MTTTELINLLKEYEKDGLSGTSRKISISLNGKETWLDLEIEVMGTGFGSFGPELELSIKSECIYENDLE